MRFCLWSPTMHDDVSRWKALWLCANMVFFSLALPTWHLWKIVFCNVPATSIHNDVAQKWKNCRFSTHTTIFRSRASLTNCAVRWYNLFAWLTLIRSTKTRFPRPLGDSSDLKGTGPLVYMFFSLILRALDAVPHGGARKSPITSHLFNKFWPRAVVRSVIEIGAREWRCFIWSTPKHDAIPKWWRAELAPAASCPICWTAFPIQLGFTFLLVLWNQRHDLFHDAVHGNPSSCTGSNHFCTMLHLLQTNACLGYNQNTICDHVGRRLCNHGLWML